MMRLKTETYEIFTEVSGDETLVKWRGRSLERSPGDLINPFFEEVVAVTPVSSLVKVDVTELTQMNSSTMPCFILLMKALGEKGVSADFIYDAGLQWQTVSFRMLAACTKIYKSIRIMGKNGELLLN